MYLLGHGKVSMWITKGNYFAHGYRIVQKMAITPSNFFTVLKKESLSTQEGKWWIDGNRFYEIAPNVMEKPDVYQFKILDEDEIHFRSVKDDYEFTDRRIEDFRQGQGVWL
jgi:hypothetical protein